MAKHQTRCPEVYKFGGASLADGAAYRHAAGICKRCPARLAVVCSAPAGVTDLLLAVAEHARAGNRDKTHAAMEAVREKYRVVLRQIALPQRARSELTATVDASMAELDMLAGGLSALRELTPRTSDLVVSRGERLSAEIFCAVLRASGSRAEYVDALEVVHTEGPFGGAGPNLARTDAAVRARLRPLLSRRVVPVVPGFLGAWHKDHDEPAALVTLGRGGSDLTATLLGRALEASRVTLWKDVPGLLTADPRVVKDARVIPQLHVREAAELAYYGAKVLHSRALIPVQGRAIPVFVRPFAEPAVPGTEISARHDAERHPVKALSAVSGQALVTVAGRGLLGVPGVAARTFAALSAHGMSVSLITQSSSEQSICFTLPEKEAKAAKEHLDRAFHDEIARRDVDGIQVQTGMTTIAVVGLGMAGMPGIAARVFSALAAQSINVVAIAQGSSELNISLVVGAAQAAQAQKRIHAAFRLSKPS
jgi:aspartokinase/homoserine dehydrogenase 1